VVCLLGVAIVTVPVVAGSETTDDETESELQTVDQSGLVLESTSTATQSSDVVATFTATNSGGGFISFNETTLDTAKAEGLTFSSGDIVIEGEIYDNGTWDSTDTSFKTLNTESDGSGFDAQPSAPNGLEGTFDPETGRMTANGKLRIELALTGDSFSFNLAMVSGSSNGAASSDGLQGSFDATIDDGGPVRLVDNEYTIPEETGNNLLDSQLGLPIEDPGLAWFALNLDLETKKVVPDTGSLTGTVTDDNGDPLSGATVDISGSAKSTTTGSDGSFSFSKLDADTYDVQVSADRYQQTTVTVEVVGGEQTQRSISLQPQPAELELSLDGSVVTAGEDLEVVGTITNVGGTATTETATISIGSLSSSQQSVDLAPGESVALTERVSTSEETVGEYTAELSVGDKQATTEAVVRDPFDQKQPVATFTAENAGEGLISFSSDFIEAVVDGAYFPTDEIVIEGELYSDGTWRSTDIQIPQIQTSADQVEVTVDVPGGITGTIDREAETMTANAEFDVSVVGRDANFQFVIDATTGTSGGLVGDASFSGDTGQVTLMDNQFTVDQTTGDDLVDTGLELPADEPGENWFSLVLDMQFDDNPTGTLSGTVTDQNGDPVSGATVALAGTETTTSSDGSYEFAGAAVGSYDLSVTAPGADTKTVPVTVESGTETTRNVELTVTGSVAGTVTNQQGDPIADATVDIGAQTAQTDADGQYTIDGIDTGARTLTVTTPDGAERTTTIDIVAGELADGSVTFDQVGSVTGVVETTRGDPVPGVPVSIQGVDASTTTGEDGSYTLGGIPVGTQTLVVDPPEIGAKEVTVDIAVGEQRQQDVTLDLAGTVRGTVIKAVGSPFEGATVRLVDETGQAVAETTTGSDGSYEFTGVAAGEYGLVADGGDSGSQRATVTVEPGGTTEQTLELSQANLDVTVGDVQTSEGTSTEVTATVKNVGAARASKTVSLSIGDLVSTTQEVELDPSESTTITLEVTPSASGEFPIVATVGDQRAEGTLTVAGGGVVATFRAEAVGDSYVSFGKAEKQKATGDATRFPDANEVSGDEVLYIEGEILEGGTWRSTRLNFPQLTKSGLKISVENRSRLTGTIDPASGTMSVDAEFLTTILVGSDPNPNFEFGIEADTGESNALSGSADFEKNTLDLADGESFDASVSLVDNDFAVNDKTGNAFADRSLSLPSTTPSNNWFNLNLDLQIREGNPGGGTVTGTVTDADGNPIENASVTAGSRQTRTDAQGQYTLEEVTEGDVTVTANAPEYEETTADSTVTEDSTTEQDLELTPGTPDYRLAVDASSVTEGETLTVDGAVANVGTATGTVNARLTVIGETTTARDFELGPQEDAALTEKIKTSAGDAGEYTVVLRVGDKTTETTVTVEAPEDESDESSSGSSGTATFRATSTGGFISFNEQTLDSARENGITFPDGSSGDPIVIEGDISSDGTWESTSIDFPVLNTAEDGSGFDAQATFPDGLEGTFDPETGRMTAEGTLKIKLKLTGSSFSFDIALTTATSNGAASSDGLEGSFAAGDPVEVTLVDNEYTVDTTTSSNLLNTRLGLPITDPGLAWLELGLSMDITTAEQAAKSGTVAGTVTDDSGAPVPGATVAVEGAGRTTTADDGSYELAGVPSGSQTIGVETAGYETTTRVIQVEQDSTTQTDLSLTALPPNFEADLSAPEASAGETVTVTGTVQNTGGPGSETVTISVDGQTTTETVDLGPGASTTVEFEFQPDSAGEYSASMAVGERTEAARANVVVDDGSDASGGDTGEVTGFIATSRGGFTSFTEGSESAARENAGVTYPSAEDGTPIKIGATIDGNTWQASAGNISFPTLTTSGLEVQVSAPNGLDGRIDRESGEMTATGKLRVEIGDGNSFTFQLDATSTESGALSGSSNFGGEPPTVTLVDNELTVPDTTGEDIIDQRLGLPTERPGENWFELKLALEFVSGENASTAVSTTTDQPDETDDDGGSSMFTTLGLAGGVAGLGLAGVFVLLVLARRLISLLDPDPNT
jgi:protocatechuate 3,4-dioxygenase beta subunit